MHAAGSCESRRRWTARSSMPLPLACSRSAEQADATRSRTLMDPKLLEILVCPVTKGPLVYDRERQELVSKSARLAYPIRDGIPVMLEDEARKLTPEECEC